ncbi:MAG: serine/threonine-protein kinase, partial [Deltaproteobacteria bacterium]
DTTLDRTVAIKLISKKDDLTVAMAEARRRLIQEAQAAGRLTHPNIVTIYSYGDTEEFQYICMEYVVGRTLAEVLRECPVLDIEEALSIFEQILQALDAASHEGIVHRDIKPANIIITPEGKVKVMDFGIAKLPSLSMTTTGTVLGTPYYMSPEQISGQKVDTRSDIFSVGAVLYQALTGTRPFEGESTVALVYKIIQSEPVPANILNVRTSASVANVIEKALAKDPWQRYQTPAEMLQALKSAVVNREAASPGAAEATLLQSCHDATVISSLQVKLAVVPVQKTGTKKSQSMPDSNSPQIQVYPTTSPTSPKAGEEKVAVKAPGPLLQEIQSPANARKKTGYRIIAAIAILIVIVATGVLVSKFLLGRVTQSRQDVGATDKPNSADTNMSQQIQSNVFSPTSPDKGQAQPPVVAPIGTISSQSNVTPALSTPGYSRTADPKVSSQQSVTSSNRGDISTIINAPSNVSPISVLPFVPTDFDAISTTQPAASIVHIPGSPSLKKTQDVIINLGPTSGQTTVSEPLVAPGG